jgi:hypothetical protein
VHAKLTIYAIISAERNIHVTLMPGACVSEHVIGL